MPRAAALDRGIGLGVRRESERQAIEADIAVHISRGRARGMPLQEAGAPR